MEEMKETMTEMELRMMCLELAWKMLEPYSIANVPPTELAGKLFDFVKDGKDTLGCTIYELATR